MDAPSAPSQRTASLGLIALSLFLLAFPLTIGKPGLPPNLKADEAAYYLMALSLVHDHDLRLDLRDTERVFHEYPYGPVRNLIAMTDDGWQTVYFGKPYVYSLFAAPFAGLFGADGLIFFNMLLMVGMVWLGVAFLRRHNPQPLAVLFSAGFFLLSSAFAYVFWLHPEVFNMASIALCLFAGLDRAEETGRRALWLAVLSGAALAPAVYNKPMLAALGLPVLFELARGRRWRPLGAWLLGAAVTFGAFAGVATVLTGHPSSYLGVQRQGVTVCSPDEMPIQPVFVTVPAEPASPAEPAPVTEPASSAAAAPEAAGDETSAVRVAQEAAAHSPTGNAWSWLFRVPHIVWGELAENAGYFLWGRHTGLLLYLPFAPLAVLLFLLHGRRSGTRWVLLGSLVAVALFFLVFIFFNWHGGGGFIGNRYFVNCYPAFLFLVTRLTPRWLTAAGYTLAGLLVAPILLTPFGANVPEPTLQAHVRNAPFRFFPLELSLRNVPGYEVLNIGDQRFLGRDDVVRPQGEQLWLHGAARVEVWWLSATPVERAVFELRSGAPHNLVELRVGDDVHQLDFAAAGQTARLELQPGKPERVRTLRYGEQGDRLYVYRLVVRSASGRVQPWTRLFPPNPCSTYVYDASRAENFYLGTVLTYLGDGAGLEADLYHLRWGQMEVPAQVSAGQTFTVVTRLFNRSEHAWAGAGAARVKLAYHWLDTAGATVVQDGRRTELPREVAPGERLVVSQQVTAPEQPGRYILELDPVLEHVAWFGARNGGDTYRAEVEVVAPQPAGSGS